MSEEAYAMDPIQREIVEMKGDIKSLEKDVSELKNKTTRHDEQIFAINKNLDGIKDDTRWIKRTITGAFITGLIAGAIALFYANF